MRELDLTRLVLVFLQTWLWIPGRAWQPSATSQWGTRFHSTHGSFPRTETSGRPSHLGHSPTELRYLPFNDWYDQSYNNWNYQRKTYYNAVQPPVIRNLQYWGSKALAADLKKNDFDPEECALVALGRTWLSVDRENGFVKWGAGIPKYLDNKLRGRQLTLPHVNLVSLGPNKDSYFVQFEDGTCEWCALPEELSAEIERDNIDIQTIAWGKSGSYYCRWVDGSDCWDGIPRSMHNLLNGRQKPLPPPKHVTMGPNGEWFVAFEDGDWQCGGMTRRCAKAIDAIQRQNWDIALIEFGHNGSWLILYGEEE